MTQFKVENWIRAVAQAQRSASRVGFIAFKHGRRLLVGLAGDRALTLAAVELDINLTGEKIWPATAGHPLQYVGWIGCSRQLCQDASC